MPKNCTPALPAEVPRLYEGYIPDRHTQTPTARAENQYHRRFERTPKHQRATDYDGAPCARARGGAVVQALAPTEQREEAEELWLYDQRHVQVLRDHVDAQWEGCDAPEE